jgi:hypothetical protein
MALAGIGMPVPAGLNGRPADPPPHPDHGPTRLPVLIARPDPAWLPGAAGSARQAGQRIKLSGDCPCDGSVDGSGGRG